MTMYDDERVVTLLREVALPAAPTDRLTQVSRRARARESRLMGGLAGALALVLVGGVFGAASLRGDDVGTQVLTVAGAAQATAEAGSARVTMVVTVDSPNVKVLGSGSIMRMSGPVDFVHDRFLLRQSFLGQTTELRGIGRDRWTRVDSGKWEHSTETASHDDFEDFDPTHLLATLTAGGTTLSTAREGDRTVFRIRLAESLFGGREFPPGSDVARVEVDGAGRVRELSSTTTQPGEGSMTITMTYDDFGIEVDVRPPPADQVVERSSTGGSSSSGWARVESGTAPSMSTLPPEQACLMVQQLEQQQASMADEQQKRAFEQMLAEIRKQCAKK